MNDPVRLFADQQPGPEPEDIGPDLVRTAKAVAAICATRMLLMIAVLAGAGIWGWTAYDPVHDRIIAAVAFSVAFLLPLVALYWRRA